MQGALAAYKSAKGKPLSEVELTRLDTLARLCGELSEPWDPHWLRPIHNFKKDDSPYKTRQRRQRRALAALQSRLGNFGTLGELAAAALDLVAPVVCEANSGTRPESLGEMWYIDELKGPRSSSSLRAAQFTCAELRALRCVSRGLAGGHGSIEDSTALLLCALCAGALHRRRARRGGGARPALARRAWLVASWRVSRRRAHRPTRSGLVCRRSELNVAGPATFGPVPVWPTRPADAVVEDPS